MRSEKGKAGERKEGRGLGKGCRSLGPAEKVSVTLPK